MFLQLLVGAYVMANVVGFVNCFNAAFKGESGKEAQEAAMRLESLPIHKKIIAGFVACTLTAPLLYAMKLEKRRTQSSNKTDEK